MPQRTRQSVFLVTGGDVKKGDLERPPFKELIRLAPAYCVAFQASLQAFFQS
jgi:hypothetical protein